jgi:hypothetical protein
MPPPLLVGFAALRRTCGSDTLQGYRTPKRHEASKGDSFDEKVQGWGRSSFGAPNSVPHVATVVHQERLQKISWILSGSKLQAYP